MARAKKDEKETNGPKLTNSQKKAENRRKAEIAEKQQSWTMKSDPEETFIIDGFHDVQNRNFMEMYFLDESEYLYVTCGDGEGEYIDVSVGDLIADDAKGKYKFKIMKKMFEKTHLWVAFGLDKDFSFKEGNTSNIDFKFSPHIVSIFLAALHRLPVALTWLDTCALLEICDYSASTATYYDYVKPALLRLAHQNFTRIMDIFFLYQHYRTRGIIDEEETLNSRNIYDRTFYLLLQSSNFKFIFKLNNMDYQEILEHHHSLLPKASHLAAACANSSKCFYYRTNWDARILMVRMWTENRGGRSDQDIQSDYMEVFSKFNAPAALNQLLSPSIMRQVLSKGMLVQPNEHFWAFDIKSFPRRIKEYKNKANQKQEKQITKVKTKMRAFTFDNSSDEDSSSLEWDDRDEDPVSPQERQRSREIENRRRKIRRKLEEKTDEFQQMREAHKNGLGERKVPLNSTGSCNYDAMQRPLVGKLLKINRRDKYAVVQWITPGCELLSDVDYAGPGILYENHAQFDKRMEIAPNSNKVVKYWLKKEAFHIELAEDIYPYVNVYEKYFQNLTTA